MFIWRPCEANQIRGQAFSGGCERGSDECSGVCGKSDGDEVSLSHHEDLNCASTHPSSIPESAFRVQVLFYAGLSTWDHKYAPPRSAVFVFLAEMGFHLVGQAGFELLASSDPPASAPQSTGITGASHRARPYFTPKAHHRCFQMFAESQSERVNGNT